jgi:rhodanese-related sulfurtransferase
MAKWWPACLVPVRVENATDNSKIWMERMMRLKLIPQMAAALVVGVLISGVAQAGDTPAALAGAKLVAADDVVKAQSAGAAIIDTRVASEYAEGHIKGALSVPYREKSEKSVNFDAAQDEFNLAKLPADKASAVVIYCNGPECSRLRRRRSRAVIPTCFGTARAFRTGSRKVFPANSRRQRTDRRLRKQM